MKIAHFISNPLENEKSAVYVKSMVAYNLCINLAKEGHSVQIFAPSQDRFSRSSTYKGISINQYGSIFNYRSEYVSPKILYDPLTKDFDIIHIHSGISLSVIAGYRFATKKRKPLIVTWHGDSTREYGRYNGILAGSAAYFYKHFLVEKILSRADAIISPSESYVDASRFINKYKDKVVTVPNGININDFCVPYSKEDCKKILGLDGEIIVLFMGSLYPLKGPDILLNAIPDVVNKYKNILFVFAGGGDISKYRELARKLGIDSYVRFTGYINNKKPLYYKVSDIFVLPSLIESFGIVNLEAMACSIAVIASNVGGIPDIVKERKNGLLVPPGDPNALTNALLYLIENEGERIRMGKVGRKMVERYSWDQIAKETENIYQKLIITEN